MDENATYEQLRAGARVQLCDRRLKDEYPREEHAQYAREQRDHWHAAQDPQLPPPPPDPLVLRSPLLDAERPPRPPPSGLDALLDAPVLDEGDGPEEEQGRVQRRVGRPEEVECDAREGDEDEELGVRREEGEVQRNGLAELFRE